MFGINKNYYPSRMIAFLVAAAISFIVTGVIVKWGKFLGIIDDS